MKFVRIVLFVSIFAMVSPQSLVADGEAGFIPYLTDDQGQATAILMKKKPLEWSVRRVEPVVYIENLNEDSGQPQVAMKNKLTELRYVGFNVGNTLKTKITSEGFTLFVQAISSNSQTNDLKTYNKLKKGEDLFGAPASDPDFVEFTIAELTRARYVTAIDPYYKITKNEVPYGIQPKVFEALDRLGAFKGIKTEAPSTQQPVPAPQPTAQAKEYVIYTPFIIGAQGNLISIFMEKDAPVLLPMAFEEPSISSSTGLDPKTAWDIIKGSLPQGYPSPNFNQFKYIQLEDRGNKIYLFYELIKENDNKYQYLVDLKKSPGFEYEFITKEDILSADFQSGSYNIFNEGPNFELKINTDFFEALKKSHEYKQLLQSESQQQLSVEGALTALQGALDSLGASISNP